MATNIGFLLSDSVSLTTGTKIVNITGSVDCSYVSSGTVVHLDGTPFEGVSGTREDISGNSTITLRNTYNGTSLVGVSLLAFNTIEGLRDAIRDAREIVTNATGISESFSEIITSTEQSITIDIDGVPTSVTPYQYLVESIELKLDLLDKVDIIEPYINDIVSVSADIQKGIGTNTAEDSAILNALINANLASTKASEAVTSANAASTSENNALTSKVLAADWAEKGDLDVDGVGTRSAKYHAGLANADAVSASNSETNAASSKGAAATSEINADADATQTGLDRIATGEDRVSTSSDASSTATDRAAVSALYDTFDDRYLGNKTEDPTLDNDGNALLTGAVYFNTSVNHTRYYNGSTWEDPEQTVTSAALSASTSASNALTSENNSATFATNSGNSESSALASKNIATTKASDASTSETNAATSATNALADADRAEVAAEAATDASIINNLSIPHTFDTVALFKASLIVFPNGKTIHLNDRDADFVKITGTDTANTYNIIASTGVNQSIVLTITKLVSVRAFGAIGGNDASVQESSGAIQAAWDSGRTLYFPKPHYRVDTPLDFAGDFAGGRALIGENRGISRNGTVIHLNTGAVGVDMTGTQAVKIRDITFDTTDPLLTNPSTVGILQARATDSPFAQFNVTDNVSVLMHDDSSANGGEGTIAIYNIAAEITTYRDIYLSANSPLVISATNIKNIVSPYKTIGGPTSCSHFKFDGTCTFNAIGTTGYSLEMSSVAVVEGMVYLSRSGGVYTDTYAMKMSGSMDTIELKAQVEFHEGVAILGNGCDGLDIHATKAVQSTSPFKTDLGFVGISRSRLRCDNILAIAATAPYILEAKAGDAVSDVELISKIWTPSISPTNATTTALSYDIATENKRKTVSSIDFTNAVYDTKTTALSYYKKGSLSPVVRGLTTDGTTTYSVRGGYYERVGRLVNFTVTISWSGHTGTGDMVIDGFPFSAIGSPTNRTVTSIFTSGISGVSGQLVGLSKEGEDYILIYDTSAGSSSRLVVQASGNLTVSGFYYTEDT
jgi:hypothetical protein